MIESRNLSNVMNANLPVMQWNIWKVLVFVYIFSVFVYIPCLFTFYFPFLAHKLNCHDKSKQKYKCDHCGDRFPFPSHLKLHQCRGTKSGIIFLFTFCLLFTFCFCLHFVCLLFKIQAKVVEVLSDVQNVIKVSYFSYG